MYPTADNRRLTDGLTEKSIGKAAVSERRRPQAVFVPADKQIQQMKRGAAKSPRGQKNRTKKEASILEAGEKSLRAER